MVDFFYNIPNNLLILVFIVVLVSLALIGLYIFIVLTDDRFSKRFDNANTNIYLSLLVVVIGVVMAFVITDEWQNFTQIQSDLITEANVLFLLIQTIEPLPDTSDTIIMIVQYICSIINVEFPAMQIGQLPPDNVFLDSLQVAIYEYHPLTTRDTVLYDKSIDLLNQAIFLRNKRLEASVDGLPAELWTVLLLGVIVLIIMSWFITGDNYYRAIMVILIVTTYASLLFLIVALDFPFMGQFSLTAEPFQFVLDKLGVKNCPENPISTQNKLQEKINENEIKNVIPDQLQQKTKSENENIIPEIVNNDFISGQNNYQTNSYYRKQYPNRSGNNRK